MHWCCLRSYTTCHRLTDSGQAIACHRWQQAPWQAVPQFTSTAPLLSELSIRTVDQLGQITGPAQADCSHPPLRRRAGDRLRGPRLGACSGAAPRGGRAARAGAAAGVHVRGGRRRPAKTTLNPETLTHPTMTALSRKGSADRQCTTMGYCQVVARKSSTSGLRSRVSGLVMGSPAGVGRAGAAQRRPGVLPGRRRRARRAARPARCAAPGCPSLYRRGSARKASCRIAHAALQRDCIPL